MFYVIINITYRIRGGSRTAATSKMERFVIIVNGFLALTIITKQSILNVAAVLDPPLRILDAEDYLKCFEVILPEFFRRKKMVMFWCV